MQAPHSIGGAIAVFPSHHHNQIHSINEPILGHAHKGRPPLYDLSKGHVLCVFGALHVCHSTLQLLARLGNQLLPNTSVFCRLAIPHLRPGWKREHTHGAHVNRPGYDHGGMRAWQTAGQVSQTKKARCARVCDCGLHCIIKLKLYNYQ